MCFGCELKMGESNQLLSDDRTDTKVMLDRVPFGFRIHLIVSEGNIKHHHARDIYYCPFCGRNLKEGGCDD